MRYIGGKTRIAKDLAPIILKTRPSVVVEPFCGALNVSMALLKLDKSVRVLDSDSHRDLILFWQDVQKGWIPPDNLSREEYAELKSASDYSPLRTFAGYGCSFAGKWFGGYASDNTSRNYCANAKNAILKRRPYLDRMTFKHVSYEGCDVFDDSVIYCDPPYAETTKPGARGEFDHAVFWQWVEKQTVPCFVSEYTAPANFRAIWTKTVNTDMRVKDEKKAVRVEKLFCKESP